MSLQAESAPASTRESTVARDSLTIGAWTAVSRATGLIRMVTTAAVLGPTFLANIYQSTNILPTMLYHLLAGPLIAAVLVPPLVEYWDRSDDDEGRNFANAALGLIMSAFAMVVLLVFLAGPILVRLLTLGVADETASEARYSTWILLLLVAPQVVLYGVTGVSVAVQQSRGRFAFPAAAQIIENTSVVILLVAASVIYGAGATVGSVNNGFLLTVGLGTTAAVALHASSQWISARSMGITLRPSARWRRPDIRSIVRLAIPTLGTTVLGSIQFFALIVVAGLTAGGVIAVQLGIQFSVLPIALGARPVSQALLPQLARLRNSADPRVADEYGSAVGMALWIAVPAALGLVLLSDPLARLIALGEMDTPRGVELIRVSTAAWGLSVVGSAVREVARQANYSGRDATGPFIAAASHTVGMLPFYAAAVFLVSDTTSLLVLGAGSAATDVVSATILHRRVGAGTRIDLRILRWLARDIVLAGVALGAALAVITVAEAVGPASRIGLALAMGLAVVTGTAIYGALQLVVVGSPELGGIRGLPRPWLARVEAGSAR